VSPVRASRRATRGALAVGLLTAVHLVSAAQAPPTPPGAPTFETVSLTAGRSVVLATEFDIVRVAVTNPAVADATVVMPREVLVDGKAPGTISLILWGTSVRKQYDVVVDPGVPTLQQQLSAFFPGENIRVSLNPCVSHPPVVVLWPPMLSSKVTVTNFTPASTRRRASRQL